MRFYTQAIGGQWEIISERETITKVIREEPDDSDLTTKLELVQAILRFAETNLALPAGGQYQAYVDLNRPFVVWNVEATPEFSLESKSWWYPFVGSLEYQGYFKRDIAMAYANKLKTEGYDTFVGAVPAYSTLGWFNDPVLSTFINFPEADLAELLFHELAHQKLFISGDTDFNEAFATSIGREGVRRWFAAKNDPRSYAQFLEQRSRDDQVIELILNHRDDLEQLYDSPVAEESMREKKMVIIEKLQSNYLDLKSDWPNYVEYDGFMAASINNAQLNAVDTYYQLVPHFETMITLSNGELTEFYKRISRTKKMDKDERRAFLNEHVDLASSEIKLITEIPEQRTVENTRQN